MKTSQKTKPPSPWFQKSTQKETSTKLYVHEFGFGTRFLFLGGGGTWDYISSIKRFAGSSPTPPPHKLTE
jgi:hypothetical protein